TERRPLRRLPSSDHARKSRRRLDVSRATRRLPAAAAMTTPESASSGQTPPAATEKKRLPRPTLGQIGAIVGVVGGIVGLVFLFKPGWKPQAPPDVGKAEVTDIRAREPVTFARYLQRLKLPQGSLSPAQLRRRGALVEFDVQLTGFAGKQLPLRWELVDAKTNDPVASDE